MREREPQGSEFISKSHLNDCQSNESTQERAIQLYAHTDEGITPQLLAGEFTEIEREIGDIDGVGFGENGADDGPLDVESIYTRDAKRRDLLTRQQEVDLMQARDRGDTEAISVIVEANQRLVCFFAQKYRGSGVSFMDLVQEGNTGLLKAIDKFDWTLGNKFSTYASFWIRRAMSKAITDQSRTIRLPVHVWKQRSSLRKAENTLRERLGRDPSDQEIETVLELGQGEAASIKETTQKIVSLNSKVSNDSEVELGELIEGKNFATEENVLDRFDSKTVLSAVSQLSERDRDILVMRFGLDGEHIRTLQEVGDKYGLTRERVRQIEQRALENLRGDKSLKSLYFNDYQDDSTPRSPMGHRSESSNGDTRKTRVETKQSYKMLTAQQRRVFKLYIQGLSHKDIAESLGIAEATVKAHIINSNKKIGASNRNQAIQLAIEYGIGEKAVLPTEIDMTRLTAREYEVFTLLQRGFTNNQISQELGMTIKTAKNYVSSLLKKLGVNSRFSLVEQPDSELPSS